MSIGLTSKRVPSQIHLLVLIPALALGAVAGAWSPLQGQENLTCTVGIISEVVIDNNSVFDYDDVVASGRFSWAVLLANKIHRRSRREFLERELLFKVGDCYDAEVFRDTERLLRSYNFIARADIYGVQLDETHYRVFVYTQDDWSTRAGMKIRTTDGIELTGIRAGEENLFGTGRYVSFFYDRSEEEKVYGAVYATPQVFGTRADFSLQGASTEAGHIFTESVSYPFVGESGRWAAREGYDRRERYFELFSSGENGRLTRIWVPIRREEAEVGGAFRWGAERYRHLLFGASLAYERIDYPAVPIFPDSAGRPAVPASVLGNVWQPLETNRVVFLVGGRDVSFVRRHAFDTLNGSEDLQLGIEGEIWGGPTIPGHSTDHEIAFGMGVSGAVEPSGATALGGHFAIDGRLASETPDNFDGWRDVFAELDAWAYLQPSVGSRQTLVAAVSGVGGWHGRIPFQLTLGGDSGLRGYPRHLAPGGRRLVGSLEHRVFWGWPFGELLDLGSVSFVDAGKIWPGDVVFGTESPVRMTVGVGLRAAFPTGSRQTFRADVGVPIGPGVDSRGLVFSFGAGQAIGRKISRRDPQLTRSSRYRLTSADFLQGSR